MRGNPEDPRRKFYTFGSIPAHAGEPAFRSIRRRGCAGSIPAHAGEPNGRTFERRSPRVYPRACGGTPVDKQTGRALRGLSPRMRGNRRCCGKGSAGVGSIPAHAGEPPEAVLGILGARVYPRACGGTFALGACDLQRLGLSPRMRGNLRWDPGRSPRRGSIPAHAGEPGRYHGTAHPSRVYPRACGGT